MDPAQEATLVYRRQNERLPVYTRTQVGGNHNSCNALKIYYYCVTVPGFGSFTAALRSGTRNLPEGAQVNFWFDELEALGLADAATVKGFQEKVWQVCM